MARTLYGPGAHGGIVGEIQRALQQAGFDPQGVDEDYGGKTANAARQFQQARGLAATGVVDDVMWQGLMQRPVPTTEVRTLELTAAFEGHGYTRAEGNFDGAWLTWGIIGFTMKYGKVQEIVLEIHRMHPHLVGEAFGDKAAELVGVMQAPAAQQEAWANSVSANGRLVQPWRAGFDWFGQFPEVRAVQRRLANEEYFKPAVRTAKKMGLKSELGLGLCFDIHVQNGGIKKAAREIIEQALAANPPANEKALRRVIANAVADVAREKYRDDVRSRKLAIAEGQGRVHGHNYTLENWGLGEFPAPELN
jgi:peptidoglycan hydrolase-like protein with peptidoglycan-binding domain/uncharacterized protein YneF (UPF0154 family)